ncbi:MAG TPA: phosphopantetheine-binding protein [Jatrophihabitans sp.]|nr:phosphopantetheine-binding protein [Jatrophihabitans sp.]
MSALQELLAGHPAVAAARVVGGCAYVAGEQDLDPIELRGYLSLELPDHELPRHIVQVDSVDGDPLPVPGDRDYGCYQPPADQVEARMVLLWQELLGQRKLGVLDNFFAVGGDSLAAANLTSVIQQSFGVNINLIQILRAQTVAELCGAVREQLAHC